MKIQELHTKQQQFFSSNATKSVSFRIEQLKKFKRIVQENESDLYSAILDDFGKSEFETYASELSLLYHEINIFIKNIRRWSRRKKVSTGLANFPARSYIIPEPLGVTLVIGAWNYPYQLSFLPAVTSMAAGNTVIIKPSELPPKTSAVMAKIINSNFSPSYIHVVEGGVQTTTELLEHRFDKIFFTGSIPVGKIIYEAAAKHLTPVTLELGGKSPCFVLPDCDINMTAQRVVWAKFFNAGQTCVAPDFILVDKLVEQKLLKALKNTIQKYYRDSNDIGDTYVQIINTENFDRLQQLIDADKVYFGGSRHRDKRYISPTILQNVTFDDEVMRDEIFGPILPVIPYTDINEAIAKVKERPKPLSCYIYSKSRKIVKQILNEVSFGGGAVNDSVMHLSNSNLPFGGVGFSGIGSYHGKAGFNTFSHYKSILHKPFWFEPSVKYPPYSSAKLGLIKWLQR
ncbi:MAG TPA: aldehyde dehydrogenase [Perlabentimonas sp.]|nr:aldehyde dehydrogenase [Tenuifilaceae bacterium]HZJ74444.1 aldehyde dehydrogenase [Perlabentimonas sp.]